jgi:hypothetical protein
MIVLGETAMPQNRTQGTDFFYNTKKTSIKIVGSLYRKA